MKTDWPSTKALSVHNAIRIVGRAMTRDELVGFLQRGHHATVDEEYVDIGVAFLVKRGFSERVGDLIANNPRIGQLVRADKDHDLEPSGLGPTALVARK